MLAHRRKRWPNIKPTSGFRVHWGRWRVECVVRLRGMWSRTYMWIHVNMYDIYGWSTVRQVLMSIWCYYSTENNRQWHKVWPMLGQRRRRWPNIDPTLCRYVMFAGSLHTVGITQPWRQARDIVVTLWWSLTVTLYPVSSKNISYSQGIYIIYSLLIPTDILHMCRNNDVLTKVPGRSKWRAGWQRFCLS